MDHGKLACNGPAQKLVLICENGRWNKIQVYTAKQNCDQRTGVCTDIVLQCLDRVPGESVCEGDTRYECGPDLVTAETEECEGRCVQGVCEPPFCGDGKLEAAEECDDGNSDVTDGCEPDCLRTQVLEVAAFYDHTCALLHGGYVRCWGDNAFGQLGYGHMRNIGDNEVPASAGNLLAVKTVSTIAVGGYHTCALLETGEVRCWGRNSSGQLGYGHTESIGDDSVDSYGLTSAGINGSTVRAKAIAAGGVHTCALLETGAVRCWGYNSYGQLGYGHTDNIGDDPQDQYTAVSAGIDGTKVKATAIAAGGNHTCALLDSGAVRCWGANYSGQLGYGHTNNIGDDETSYDEFAVQVFVDAGQ